MATLNLGTKTIWVEDKWVSFERVNLAAGLTYSLIFEPVSNNPDKILSYFLVRYRIREEGERIYSLPIGKTYYDNGNVFIDAFISPNMGNNKNIFFEVRRFPYYPDSSELAQVDITLKIDPEDNY